MNLPHTHYATLSAPAPNTGTEGLQPRLYGANFPRPLQADQGRPSRKGLHPLDTFPDFLLGLPNLLHKILGVLIDFFPNIFAASFKFRADTFPVIAFSFLLIISGDWESHMLITCTKRTSPPQTTAAPGVANLRNSSCVRFFMSASN